METYELCRSFLLLVKEDGGSILTSILCVVDKLINDTKNKFEILGKDREAV
jgi:hypothetical protein